MKRGRKKEYTADGLRRAVEKYFRSITREITVTEQKATGRRDEKGHMIYEEVPVINSLGKEVRVTEYIVPPSVADLSDFLGIHRSTWDNYCDKTRYPEFAETTEWARARMQAWNERELVTRSGRDLKGIIFNLENNYDYREKQSLDLSGGGIEAYLQKLAEGKAETEL
nr:terminase small subunit [uncultured Oscillibacter sp.]